MRSEPVEQKTDLIKHFVIRCEQIGAENQAWRFLLIDPQTAEKAYLENLDGLQQALLKQLEKLLKGNELEDPKEK